MEVSYLCVYFVCVRRAAVCVDSAARSGKIIKTHEPIRFGIWCTAAATVIFFHFDNIGGDDINVGYNIAYI